MKVKGISWVGLLTDDYDGTKDFWGKILGLSQEWTNADKGNTFFPFPSGQEIEVYSAANHLRRDLNLSQRLRPPMTGVSHGCISLGLMDTCIRFMST